VGFPLWRVLLQVDVLGGLYDLRDEVSLERFGGECGIGDKFVDLPDAFPQLGVVPILDLVVGPA